MGTGVIDRLAGTAKWLIGDRHVVLTMGTNLFVMACAIGPAILAARALGPSGRGELAAALVWSSLLGAVAQLGLPQALTFFAATRRLASSELILGAVSMGLVQGAVVGVATVAALPLIVRVRPEIVPSLRVVVFLVPLVLIATYSSAILQGASRFSAWNASRVLAALAYPAALVVALVSGTRNVPGILAFAVVFTAVTTGLVLALFVWVSGRPGPARPGAIRDLLAYGLRAYWGNLAWLANTRLDQFVISLLLPFASLGHYAVAASVSGALQPVSAAFASVTFAKVPGVPPGERRGFIRGRAIRATAVAATIAVVTIFIAPWLIPGVFGAPFAASVLPARILLAGAILLGLNYVLSDSLRALNRPATVAVIETAGLVVTAALLTILVPRYGITGAAVACSLAYAVISALLVSRVRAETAPSSRGVES
jgi:O-antigen/teichoic acid export membrane protein